MRFDHSTQTMAVSMWYAVVNQSGGSSRTYSRGGIRTRKLLAKAIIGRKEQLRASGCVVDTTCNGKKHRIMCHDGTLRLFNHTDEQIRRFQAVEDLGGSAPRCLQILLMWREGRAGPLPKQLSELRRRAWELSLMRTLLRNPEPKWFDQTTSGRPKWLVKIDPLIQRVIRHHCRYKMIEKYGGHILMISGGYKKVGGVGDLIPNILQYPHYALCLEIPNNWYDNCFLRFGGILPYGTSHTFFVLDWVPPYALVMIEKIGAERLFMQSCAIECGIHGNRLYHICGKKPLYEIEDYFQWNRFLKKNGLERETKKFRRKK